MYNLQCSIFKYMNHGGTTAQRNTELISLTHCVLSVSVVQNITVDNITTSFLTLHKLEH